MTDQNNYILKETDSNLFETEEDKRFNTIEGNKKELIDGVNSIKQNGIGSSEKETEITEEHKTKFIQNVQLRH